MRALAVVLGLVLCIGSAHAALPIYDSPEGGFAFTPPAGWETKKEADQQFPTVSGPADDLKAPYVVIKEVRNAKDIFALGDATVKQMLKSLSYQLSSRDAFQTADKAFGIKYVLTVTTTPTNGKPPEPYRQAYYFVEGPPGIIYAFLATVPETGWEKYNQPLDLMIRTYHLRPVVAAKANPAPTAPIKSGKN